MSIAEVPNSNLPGLASDYSSALPVLPVVGCESSQSGTGESNGLTQLSVSRIVVSPKLFCLRHPFCSFSIKKLCLCVDTYLVIVFT